MAPSLLVSLLANPDDPTETLELREGSVVGRLSGRVFPIRDGMIDFLARDAEVKQVPKPAKAGLPARINEYYNLHIEQQLASSIFASGGPINLFVRRKMAHWLSDAKGVLLDVGCGNRYWAKYKPDQANYVGLDCLTISLLSPWREALPDVNADALKMPFLAGSIDTVMSVFVLEHVVEPGRLISEISRVLRPGGFLLLTGPGDLTMTHGEPHNYFNLTRFAYRRLLAANGFEVYEEYCPARFWITVLHLLYLKIVRNDAYNRSSFTKLIQFPVFLVSVLVSPPLNLLALALDAVLPDDRRGCFAYMVLARKKITP